MKLASSRGRPYSVLAAMSFATLLVACGGGGSGSSQSVHNVATQTGALAPQTSVPAATYAAGSAQAVMYQAVNNLRSALGVGLLAQDAALDTAATAHAQYLLRNQLVQHEETAGMPGYYGPMPQPRAVTAGAPATEWVGEVAAGWSQNPQDATQSTEIATGCFNEWYTTVYHLAAMVSNQQTIGIGIAPNSSVSTFGGCVLDFGTTAGVPANPAPNSIPYSGGQQIATTAVITVPHAQESGVFTGFDFAGEAPSPAPDLTLANLGRPVMVMVNGNDGAILTVKSFSLADSSGASVPSRILVSVAAKSGSVDSAVADPNANYLADNEAFILPLAHLQNGMTYTATFTGARNGTPVNVSWSFTTEIAAAQFNQIAAPRTAIPSPN